MMAWTGRPIAPLTPALLASAAAARDTEREITVPLHVRAPGISSSIKTRFGTIRPGADIGGVLPAADFVLMSMIEARRGRRGLIADLDHADPSRHQDAPLDAPSARATAGATLKIASGHAAHRLHEDARVSADPLGGNDRWPVRGGSRRLSLGKEPSGADLDLDMEEAGARPRPPLPT